MNGTSGKAILNGIIQVAAFALPLGFFQDHGQGAEAGADVLLPLVNQHEGPSHTIKTADGTVEVTRQVRYDWLESE